MKYKNRLRIKGKKIISILVLIGIIMIIIFLLFGYKKMKQGNNNNIKKDVEEYILDISSYKAIINVNIKSNKNDNNYKMEQVYVSPDKYMQKILEPENIKDVISKYDGKTLTVENTKLNLKNIYDNYKQINDNDLYLSSFIKQYKECDDKIVNEDSNDKIIEINKNNKTMKLFVNKIDYKPTKLIIKDKNEDTSIYIEYNEIEINNQKIDDLEI